MKKSEGPINLTNQWRKRLWISLHVDLNRLNQPEESVISTEEMQFNHKPAKMLLTEQRRESAKMAKPQV